MNDQEGRLPGSVGIWTFLFMDMIIFSLIFLTFLSEKLRQPAEYGRSTLLLDGWLGLGNTLILLTSSWLMVLAVQARRANDIRAARGRLLGVIGLASLFCAIKIFEYHSKLALGITPVTNSFFSFYFFVTGVHLLHVIAGMCFMVSIQAGLDVRSGRAISVAAIENVGLFWHFVDTLWVFIFPLLYLVGIR